MKYDPHIMVQSGNVIVVTINYRLGYLGFFAHPAIDERSRAEIGKLEQELVSALGLRGRDRESQPLLERARCMVTIGIKRALTRVQAASSALGRHLSARLRTGTCFLATLGRAASVALPTDRLVTS